MRIARAVWFWVADLMAGIGRYDAMFCFLTAALGPDITVLGCGSSSSSTTTTSTAVLNVPTHDIASYVLQY